MMPLLSAAPVEDTKTAARKAAYWLKKSPKRQREASLAEAAGLLFMEQGGHAYGGSGSELVEVKNRGVVERVQVPYVTVTAGARFVGTDGKLYDYYETGPHASRKKPATNEAWKMGKLYICRADKDNVFPYFDKELAELEIKRSIYLLKRMPATYRQAMFAEILHLLYMPDGSNPYNGTLDYYDFCGERVSYETFKRGAKFLDAEGNVCDYYSVWEAEYHERCYYWNCVKLCIRNHGHEIIFAPFKKEVAAMKQQRETLPQPIPAALPTPAPEPAVKETPATGAKGNPTATPMGSSSAMGSTVNPAQEG